MDQHSTCGARKPGWENGPAIGRHRIPCTRPAAHSGTHRDALGQTWAAQRDVDSADTLRAVLAAVEPDVRSLAEEFGGQYSADLAQSLRELVWSALGAVRLAA